MRHLIVGLVSFVFGYAFGEVFLTLILSRKLSWKWLAVLVISLAILILLFRGE